MNLIQNIFKAFQPDSHTTPAECPKSNYLIQLSRTFRYKLAKKGLYLSLNERRLLQLKNCHKGQRAFIIGNGPSLNLCDITKLRNETTFGVNSIFLNSHQLRPSYYVVEDVYVAEDRAVQINSYDPQVKIFGNYLKYCLSGSPNTIWLNVLFRYDNYPNFPHFSENAARYVWVGGTVTYICLQLAYYMGFDHIYLIGFDHNYQIPSSAEKTGNKILSKASDPNHFHPDYFGKGFRWHDPKVERMEKAYQKAKKVFEADGRKIYNATVGGKLEVFERVDYSKLFNL